MWLPFTRKVLGDDTISILPVRDGFMVIDKSKAPGRPPRSQREKRRHKNIKESRRRNRRKHLK